MWIWLTISMLLVIGCIIFGISSFISSRTLQKSIAAEREYESNKIRSHVSTNGLPALKKQTVENLTVKLKSIEETSLLSAYNLNDLKKRIEVLESAGNFSVVNEEEKWEALGEDWEKLYYETKREKQSLEDNLTNIKEALQENMDKLQGLEKQQVSMKSDVDSGINEVNLLQSINEKLQRKIEGGLQREKELALELAYEKSKYGGYDLIQKENSQLHSEINILTNRIEEINDHNTLMAERIKRLTELGSILEISEYEKMGIKNSVEQLLYKM